MYHLTERAMTIAAWVVLGILLLRSLVVMANLFTRQWLRKGSPAPEKMPFISVLIPARDEEANIGNLLEQIASQDYTNYEVIVYDDESKDQTRTIVHDFTRKDPRIHLAEQAGAPPAGWLGKNWACHNLALQAQGEFFLFLDADVRVTDGFLRDIMVHSLRRRLHLCSLFPVQVMATPGEKLLVPLMNRILLTLLPLILTRISKRPSLSAANGQTMLFRAGTYRQHHFHEAVKAYPVEDIRIFRMMKHHNLRTHTMLSGGQVSCRMYKGYQEALNGFSKNVFAFFGGSPVVTILFALTTAFGWIPVLLSGDLLLLILWSFLSALIITLVSLLSRQSPLQNLLLAVGQQVAFIHLIFKALKYRIYGGFQWKGREIVRM
ncbi:MAG: glycosyltransferase [Bacteroidales bacterium]